MSHPIEIMLFPNPDYENPWARPILGDLMDEEEYGEGVAYRLNDNAQAEIDRLTRENENLRQIERNLQDAWEHEHQLAERALAKLLRLSEQMKDREYD